MTHETLTVIQIILQFIAFFFLFIWNRIEARTDYRQIELKQDKIRDICEEIQLEIKNFRYKFRDTEEKKK
jgi:hypothetical protein